MHQMLFGGQAPPRPAEGAYSAPPDPYLHWNWGAYSAPPVPDRLAALHFQTKNLPNVIWRPGSAQTRWGSLQRSPRPLAALHFQTKNAPNVVWRPGSARTRWGAYSAPRHPSCIETPRAFGIRSSALWCLASCLQRLETTHSGSSFFQFEHWTHLLGTVSIWRLE